MKDWLPLGLHASAALLFGLGYYLQYSNACLSNLNKLQYSVYISRGAGLTLSVFMTLNVAIHLKHTLRFARKKLPWIYTWYPHRALEIHKCLAGILIVYSLIHSTSHYFNFYTAETLGIARMYFIHYRTYGGVTGHIMIPGMLIIGYFSTKYYRKWDFRFFEWTHRFYWFVFLAFVFHSRGCFVKQNDSKCLPYFSIYHFSFTLLLFIIEKTLYIFNKELCIKCVVYYKNTIKLTLEEKEKNSWWKRKSFRCNPGEYIKIKVPEISQEFHPFTVTSHYQFDNDIVLYIKQEGDWTCQLRDYIEDTTNPYLVSFQYQGPFSSPCDTYFKYDSTVLVATGIGITPFISVLKDYYIKYNSNPLVFPYKMELVWIINDKSDITMVQELFKKLNTLPLSCYRCKVFLTEKFEEHGWNLATSSMSRITDMRESGVELYYGRPDFGNIMENFKRYSRVPNTGVFCCANKEAKKKLRCAVVNHSSKVYTLNFIEEPFL